MERGGDDVKRKERDRMVSLFLHTELFSVYLSATNGNRVRSRKIIVRKPTSGLKHIGRNSMPVPGMRQGEVFDLTFASHPAWRQPCTLTKTSQR